jgi:hypothetical protein
MAKCDAEVIDTFVWECECCDAKAAYKEWSCGALSRDWIVWKEACPDCDRAPEPISCPNR